MELSDWHMWWKRSGARKLRQILMEEWDPIGVAGVPEAADEYDSYQGQIGSRLRAHAPADEIAAFLTDVEEVQMGLGESPTARSRNEALAARLKAWYTRAMTAES